MPRPASGLTSPGPPFGRILTRMQPERAAPATVFTGACPAYPGRSTLIGRPDATLAAAGPFRLDPARRRLRAAEAAPELCCADRASPRGDRAGLVVREGAPGAAHGER